MTLMNNLSVKNKRGLSYGTKCYTNKVNNEANYSSALISKYLMVAILHATVHISQGCNSMALISDGLQQMLQVSGAIIDI